MSDPYYFYEESEIRNQDLPPSWRNEVALDELENFLQENWNLRPAYYSDGKKERKQQFISFLSHKSIRTNQYIGSIMFNGENINIFPKMFRTDKGKKDLDPKHLMRNIVKWLEYSNRALYPYIHITPNLEDEDSFKELFITLYIGSVKNIIERGPYYQYVDETEDLVYLKGRFDVSDYIVKKIPNGHADRFRCTYSKFDYDNKINQIIKHTCKLLYPITTSNNQRSISYILARLNEVSDEKCTPGDCDRIQFRNMRDGKMLDNYRIIMSMSKMFLLNETPGLKFDYNKAYCFLFPTDLLFEGFVGGFIGEVVDLYGGKTFIQKSDMSLVDDLVIDGQSCGNAFKMKLDILVETQDKVFILDAKYKVIPRYNEDTTKYMKALIEKVDQGDLYQVCEYSRKRDVKDAFLLYPMYRYEEKELVYPIGISCGFSGLGNVVIHFIRIPFIFEEDEEKTKRLLKNIIEEMLELK